MAKVSPTNAFRARLLALLRELSFEEAITALIELATRKPVRSVFPIVSGSRSIQVRGIEKLISDGGVTRKDQEQIIKNLIEDTINKQVEKRVAQECTKDPLPSSESSEAKEGEKMNVELLTKFANLTPTEVAVLWMSTRSTPTTPQANRANVVVRADHVEVTIPIPQKEGREEVILCSKPTIVLGCLLAEGFARMEEQSSESIVTALASFTRDKIKLAADNPQSRFDIRPYSSDLHSLLFEYLLKIPGFSLPDDFYKYEKPIDHAMEKCLMAVRVLEDRGLIVDPPWRKLAAGFMLCFLGIFPTDFSIRDKPGDEIVDYIRYETRLWEFERTVSDKEIRTHFQANARLAGMLDNTIAALAKNYVDGWSAANPDQQKKLQERPSNPRLE